MRETLEVALDPLDIRRARRDPVPAVSRRPEDLRTIVKALPRQMHIRIRARYVREIEVPNELRWHVGRYGREIFGHRKALSGAFYNAYNVHLIVRAITGRRNTCTLHALLVGLKEMR